MRGARVSEASRVIARETIVQVILQAVAARLATVALDDPSVTAVTFTVHLRSGGGWPRVSAWRIEGQDELAPPPTNGDGAALDACGPIRRRA